MLRLIVRRTLLAVPILLLVSFVVFALTSLATDPARQILGDGATPKAVAALQHQLGLDESLPHRYWHWLTQLLHGSLGRSWFGNVPVATKLLNGLPMTAALVLSALALTAVVAIPIGLAAGRGAGGRLDHVASFLAGVGLAMPEFWVGLLLILILGVKLHILPGTGQTTLGANVVDDVKHLILPVLALSLPQICALYRQTRASAAGVAQEDYIRTARAGGISPRALLWVRVARNALVPSVTLLGLQLGRLIGVAAVVESVFGMHGIGSIAVQAALSSDIPVILGVVLITAVVVLAANLLADIAVYFLAPKTEASMTVPAAGAVAIAAPSPRAETPSGQLVRAFVARRAALGALIVLTVIVLVALLAPLIGLGHPNHLALRGRLQGPSVANLLGTDEVGRDELARILAATRISSWAAIQATVVGVVLGVPLGLITGYQGGRLDGVLSRGFDAVQSIPPLILAIAVVAILGRDLTPAMVSIGIVFSPTFYRVSRAAAATVAGETYIEASRSMGQRTSRIVATHVLTNVSSPLIVQISTTMAFGILAEAALSYLGLGVQPPSASLGSMLTNAANLINVSPQLTIEPGVMIIILVVCISLIGDALRDISSEVGADPA